MAVTRARRRPRRHAGRMLLIAMLAPTVAGCWATRSAGGSLAAGAIARVDREDSTLFALERRLADSAGMLLGLEFGDAVLQPARQTWSELRQGVRDEADTVTARVASRLRGDLNASLQEILRDNLDVLDRRGPALARAMGDTLADAVARALTTRVAAAGDTLALRLATAVALGLEEVLRPALHAIMRDLRDSLRVRIGDVDRAVAESRTVSGVRYLFVGAGLAAVATLLLVAFTGWRRQRRALHALIDGVEAAGDDGVRHAVRSCAEKAGVHGWLTERVAARKTEATR